MTTDRLPASDDLLFLAEHAPLEPRQTDKSTDALFSTDAFFTLFAALSSRLAFDHQRDRERAELFESIRR